MEDKYGEVILKVARGESVAKEGLAPVANLFANTTTSVAVFTIKAFRTRWQRLLAEANITSVLLLSDEDWQQNIDRALDFGDIIIIGSFMPIWELYIALYSSEKAKRKVIIRNFPAVIGFEPRGITIYRHLLLGLKLRVLRYATKISTVLRHAVIPFDASKMTFLMVDDKKVNFKLISALLKHHLGYSEEYIYRAMDNKEAKFYMDKYHPSIVLTKNLHLDPSEEAFIRTVRENPEYDDIVIGFRTAEVSNLTPLFRAGADYSLHYIEQLDPFVAMIHSLTHAAQYVKVYNEIMSGAE